MQPIKKLASDIITYGFGSVLGRMLNYLLVPLHTYLLCPEDFGVITEFYSYIAIVQIIYSCGIETAYYRFYNSLKNFKDYALTFIMLTSTLFSVIIFIFTNQIAHFIGIHNSEKYIYLCTIILLVDSWLIIPFAHFRLMGRAKLFSLIKFLQISINILLNLLIIYIPYKFNINNSLIDRVYYIFLANAIANGVFIPICIYLIDGFKFLFSKEVIKKILFYSLPIVYIGLATVLNDVFSRLAIKYWLPQKFCKDHNVEYILGIFSACQKIAVLMSIGIQAFRYAVEPMFFSQSKGSKVWYDWVMYWFIVFGCIIMFMVCLNLNLVANIFLRKEVYKEALGIVPYILFSNLLAGIYYNLSAWFKICDKTHYGIIITSLGCLTTVLLNFLLIPYSGYWGSVYAYLGSYCIMVLVSYVYGQKFYPIPYSITIYSLFIILTILSIYLTKFITYDSQLKYYTFNAILSIIFSSILFLLAIKVYKTMIKNYDN